MSSILVPARIRCEEHLDETDEVSESVVRSLRDLRAINRWTGGHRAFRLLLRRLGAGPGSDVVDLGTGTSDLLAALPQARRRIGIDFKLQHLAYGMRLAPDGVQRIAADAFRIPLRDESVHVVASSHFFHHFDEEENVLLLRESLRVARLGVAVSDTRRHWVPLAFVRAVGATGLWSEITRHDAPASVRQGYTLNEVRAIAARVGARRWKVVRQIPFRFGLLLWK